MKKTSRDHGSLSPYPNRRQFLTLSSTAAATFFLVPGRILGAEGATPPNSKLTLAGIGIGGVGNSQLQACAKAGFEIAALCDVDTEYGKKTFDLWPAARRYRDFRELLASEGDRIDAVYCGTPDHTHALITVAALRRKKHVCCVKPLTRTVNEMTTVLKAAERAQVATQVTASPNTTEEGCRTCEIIDAGVIGTVRELHLWSNRPVWPQGMLCPAGEDPVPAHLDWKLWLGPAPARPFKAAWEKDSYALAQMNLKSWDPGIRGVYHPFNFRGWWDFGTGALGDMGCHHFNTPFRALKLGSPVRVEASASKVSSESAPLASMVTYDFPARQGLPAVQAVWYDGGLKPPVPRQFGIGGLPAEGTLYVGESGYLLSTWSGITVGPTPAAERAQGVPKTLERRGGTWTEWHDACRGGEPAGCNFQWAKALTEVVLLGNIALRTGGSLDWNGIANRFENHPEGNRLLGSEYQNGWSLDKM